MAGVAGMLTIGLLFAAVACSGNHEENARSTRSNDSDPVDARAPSNDAGGRDDPAPLDAGPDRFDAQTFDARDYYCNMPNPGPCCCDPLVQEIHWPEHDAMPPIDSCDFSIEPGRGFDPRHINVVAETPDGGQDVLGHVTECTFHGTGWMWANTEPPVLRLCPLTCHDFQFGFSTALRVMQGCPAIACPPP